MSFTFHLTKDPIDCGRPLFPGGSITLNPGTTVLVGCNGSGKTTFLHMLKQQLDKEDIPYVSFDNLHDGGANARSKAGYYGDYEFLASSISSSEGENINLNLCNLMKEIARAQRENRSAEKFFILMDAIDSGLSIDNIVDLKDMFPLIREHHLNPNAEVYIVISANAYETAREENCLSVTTGNYVTICGYDAYRRFILESRARKDKY